MTTVIFIKKTCFLCNHTSRYPDFGVIHIGRPEDLDGRPSDSHRSSIYMLINRCPSCGYCAVDISTAPPSAAVIVKDPVYQETLNNKNFPETANTFLCWAMIQAHEGLYNEAGQATLFAAWVCDDSTEFREKAFYCREQTIAYFKKAREQNQPFGKTLLDEQLLLIDLMRRCGTFDEALGLSQNTAPLCNTDRSEMIIALQQDLIEKKDTRRYTLSDALNQ